MLEGNTKRIVSLQTRHLPDKKYCEYCNQFFVDLNKHIYKKCKKKYDRLIGPLPRLIICEICNEAFYEYPVYRIKFYNKKYYRLYTDIPYGEHRIECEELNRINPNSRLRETTKDIIIIPHREIKNYLS